jgi:hypothetical protein
MSLTVAGAVLPQQPHDQVLRVGEPELVEQPSVEPRDRARGGVQREAEVLLDLPLKARRRRRRLPLWEFSSGLCSWEQGPAPAQIGKRLAERLFKREVPAERAPLVNSVMRWGYGTLWGAQCGIAGRSHCHSAEPRLGSSSAQSFGPPATSFSPWSSCTSRSGNTMARRSPRTSLRTSPLGSAPAPHSDFSPRQQCEAG